jgi:predicted membrane protein DUF2339
MSNPVTPARSQLNGASDETALERIRELEASVRELKREMAQLRRQLDGARATESSSNEETLLAVFRAELTQASPPVPASTLSSRPLRIEPASKPERRAAGASTSRLRIGELDLESFIGRYGMLAVAVIATLLGVGTFLRWAIAHGWLNPAVRVVLGLISAGALAAIGLRIRERERPFGSTLLGLALAVAQVCAWAAGPSLHLVSDNIAFAFAGVASIALAAFAYREADEPLCCVGFGGAALAPFVTSSGAADALLLANYGALVLLSGCWSLRHRAWTAAERVLEVCTALYVVTLASMPERHGGPLLALALPFALILGGTLPTTDRPRIRARIRTLGVFAALAAVRVALQLQPVVSKEWLVVILAVAGLVWVAVVDLTSDAPATRRSTREPRDTDSFFDWLDACWIPLIFVGTVAVSFDANHWTVVEALAASTLVFLAFVARRAAGFLRDASAFATGVCAVAATVAAALDYPRALTADVAVLAVCYLALHLWRPSKSWLVLAGLGLLASSIASLTQLFGRTPYAYTPFATIETAVAFVIALAWGVGALWAPRIASALATAVAPSRIQAGDRQDAELSSVVRIGRALAAAWAFLWVNVEIAHAVSPTTSLLLLITYYAVTGVASVGLGRHFGVSELRKVGLGLALLAAAVAFNGARGLENVAARITGYLVTAVFLLGIAYWYRRPGTLPSVSSSAGASATEPTAAGAPSGG